MAIQLSHLCIDSHDPGPLARWWAELLGWQVSRDDADEVVVRPTLSGSGGSPPLMFLLVSDDKVVKNRLHLDLMTDDLDVELARVEALGARRVDVGQRDQSWAVLADPQGNEFCLLAPPSL
jgi:predicted enzyme related to lactoylglutathione lyase